jgi:hypothetical protein
MQSMMKKRSTLDSVQRPGMYADPVSVAVAD